MKNQKNFIGTHYPDGKGGFKFAGQPRDRKGKYSRKIGSRISTIVLLSLFLIGVIAVAVNVFSREKIVEIDEPIVIDNLPLKIEEFKNGLLDTLASCEHKNLKVGEHGIIMDSNGRISIGQFKFQVDTVIFYYSELYGRKISQIEAVNIAMDPKLSRELANDVIFETPNGLSNWLNCSKKHNLTKDLEIIKKLEK